jgi:transposase
MKGIKPLELDEAQLGELQRKLDKRELSEADCEQLKSLIEVLRFLGTHYQQAKISMQRVLKMIFGSRTEKTDKVLKRNPRKASDPAVEKPKRKGHGRLGADQYPGAERIHIAHEVLRPGQQCPDCMKGLLRDFKRPSVVLRFCAQPVIKATAYVLEQLRCALCGKTFTASPPAEAGVEKYAPNVAPMLAVLRYGFGMPMNRVVDLQKMFGVPLPLGTQWEQLKSCYNELSPVIGPELVKQAARGNVLHNDDTNGRVLDLEKDIRDRKAAAKPGEKLRTGVFTTGVVSIREDCKIALYTTGPQHAGENLQDVLDHRPAAMSAPIQMCDGLSRNEPKSETIKANCNTHGRREFVEIAEHFPAECERVLETIKTVYKNEIDTVKQKMTPDQRLLHHQQNSAQPMEQMKGWMEQKLSGNQVEPNSGLGSAFKYVLKRWDKLTLFLRQAGAPLDNNICERILKTPIRHRDNSLFYKTMIGANVGDFFMSIIQTCRLCGKDPFDYLSTLRRHAGKLPDNPSAWMPWNYQATAASLPAT